MIRTRPTFTLVWNVSNNAATFFDFALRQRLSMFLLVSEEEESDLLGFDPPEAAGVLYV